MNDLAACLGVLESCALDSCVFVGRKGAADVKTGKKAEGNEKKGGGFIAKITNLFTAVGDNATDIIEGPVKKTEVK